MIDALALLEFSLLRPM